MEQAKPDALPASVAQDDPCRGAIDESLPPLLWALTRPDHVVRTVTENSRTLKFSSQGFEEE